MTGFCCPGCGQYSTLYWSPDHVFCPNPACAVVAWVPEELAVL